jgi:hypothetical protein
LEVNGNKVKDIRSGKMGNNSNACYKCDAEIDEEDIICCNCIDNTDGRNQHFWQIKNEND